MQEWSCVIEAQSGRHFEYLKAIIILMNELQTNQIVVNVIITTASSVDFKFISYDCSMKQVSFFLGCSA